MAEEHENLNVAKEWGCLTGKFIPTKEQKKIKAKTGSLYRRDSVTENYKFSKGPFV